MAIVKINAALDMTQSDPLGFGSYANLNTDQMFFARFSNDAGNYVEFIGIVDFVFTECVKVVDGETSFDYSWGTVSAPQLLQLYETGQYGAMLPLLLAEGDRISGSSGDDVITGLAGKDMIRGRGGADVINGGDDSDRLFGDQGNDTIAGGKGNDIIRGGSGRDTLTGGSGRDKFVFDTALKSSNVDTITDFKPGTDWIVLDSAIFSSFAARELLISEYVEGSGFNKAIEIFNGSGSAIDLAAGGYVLELYSNGAAAPTATLALTGIIASGDVLVLAHASADVALTALADVLNSAVINFNGDDSVVLRKSGVIVDAIGQIGFDPGTAWVSGSVSTLDQTLRRLDTVTAGDTNGSNAFDPALEWEAFAPNTFLGLGSHDAPVSPTLAEAFSNGPPTTAKQHIIYDIGTGRLSYDADGSGPGAAVLFARVNPGTVLTHDDFIVM